MGRSGRTDLPFYTVVALMSQENQEKPSLLVSSQMVQRVKKTACSAEDTVDVGLIPGWGRSPGEGNSNPLHYSCLRHPMDRGAWWATVHGVAKSRTRLSD